MECIWLGRLARTSTRQDWWLDEQEQNLYIGDTDWGGTAYRSNENAAAQLHQGLMGVIAHENFLEEIDLMIREDFAELPWYAKAYRFGTAVAANSLLSGIKSVENAIVGETISGQKLGGWERLALGTVGSVETLLIAVPLGKVAGKAALGKVSAGVVRSAMAADITAGFGPAVANKLATSRVGQGFIRAYAKVYNSKYNKALVGTTKQEIKVGGTGAAAATPDEAAIAQARQRASDGNTMLPSDPHSKGSKGWSSWCSFPFTDKASQVLIRSMNRADVHCLFNSS